MKDLTGKVDVSTTLTAAEWNELPQEIQNVIQSAGIVLSSGDLTQLSQAIALYGAVCPYMIDSGIANAYVINPIGAFQAPPAYADGMLVRFRPSNKNTGASTIRIGSLAIVDLVREATGALSADDVAPERDAYARYDSSAGDFFLSDFSLGETIVRVPRNYLDGFIIANNMTGDAANDVDFLPGQCRDSTNTIVMSKASTFVKRTDADWIAGTAAGGFPDSISIAVDTWYHCFVIGKTDGTVDFGFDSDINALNLLDSTNAGGAGYTLFRRVGSILTGDPVAVVGFLQLGDDFLWNLQTGDVGPGFLTIVTVSGTDAAFTVDHVPPDVRSILLGSILAQDDDDNIFVRWGHGGSDLSAVTPRQENHDWATYGDINENQLVSELAPPILMGTNQQFRHRAASSSGGTLALWLHGYHDFRGKE